MARQINNIDFTIDCSGVYLWQYDHAEKLQAVLKGTEQFISVAVTDFWSKYFDDVFNVATAGTFGLDLWGKTLGVMRPTYTDGNGDTVSVSDEMYHRMLIGAVYKYNMTGTVPQINYYLQYVLGTQQVYVIDGFDMTFQLISDRDFTAEELAVLTSPGFVPVPAGVQMLIPAVNKIFGFNDSELEPFDNGNFAM